MTGTFLFQAVIYLSAAVVCVPIAKRFGLSSVLGYLFAGIIIGPYLLKFIGEEGEDILHFAEFGVVMMLFLIGLEIEPKAFWKMKKTILGMGGSQVVLTTLLSFGLLSMMGYSWQSGLSIAMALSLSSTAIVLQTLKEKNLMDTVYGASSFSILLFQDIIVIPMLAVIPLFSTAAASVSGGHEGGHPSFLDNLPVGLRTVFVLLSVVCVVLAGRYLFVPLLRVVALTRLRELFSASALLIVIAIAYLMELVGLSPALGAFLGGVVLATSEFKHELESNLEPFKGLLLGLFFIAVGASINFGMILDNPVEITLLVVGVITLKGVVLYIVASIFRIKMDQKLLIVVGLSQVGEFAFVLLSFANQLGIFSKERLDLFLVITAISMTLTPLLAIFNEHVILPKIGTKESEEKPPMDTIEKKNKVILVGFGHFGSTIGRFLRANGVESTILDHDSSRVDLLRKMGFEVYYGDAMREDLLESAGAGDAKILISAIDDPDATLRMVEVLQHNYPDLTLLVRAKSRVDAYQLLNAGVTHIYRETLDTSVRVAEDALHFLGHRKYTTLRQAQNFKKYDEDSLRRLADKVLNSDEYIFKAREEIAQQEALLKEDLERGQLSDEDTSWDSESMRNRINAGKSAGS
ncbi:MAG: monovalent cation:proton antiporter-2 (CPA2) family protein [Bacteroidota bacterium]